MHPQALRVAVDSVADHGLGPLRGLRTLNGPDLDHLGVGDEPFGQRDRGGQTRHRIELAVLVDELPGVGDAEATGGEPVRRFRLRRAVGDADEQFPECRSPSRVSSDSALR